MICFAQIPLMSPGSIAAELASYSSDWKAHFNTSHYQGEWTVLPLRAPGGKYHIVPDLMMEQNYADTAHMKYFPSVNSLLRSFGCPVQSVRFLNLKAGACIKPHRDRELAFEMGEARLHFPIITNPDVAFFVEDNRLNMQAGECWYINANLTHQVHNNGNTDRVHLVVDCLVNDWLRELFSHADKHTKADIVNIEEQKQIIEALRLQNTPTATQLANQLERELGAL
ncbi:aspartyl/asparaginyl beta-hydroxylase domain-containing protein [Niabella sp. CJ426]|uniref:aspartyl/asparaginyl beta-hydroxylase domain-containing protein n=1 Tax=Niabella sp. CJ426 TaxID=3393740 RepID=UPI003D04EB89